MNVKTWHAGGDLEIEGYAWVERADPPWAKFSLDLETGFFSGCQVDPSLGKAPVGRPFGLDTRLNEWTPERVSAVGALLLCVMAQTPLLRPSALPAARREEKAEKLAAWESFLGVQETKQPPPEESAHSAILEERLWKPLHETGIAYISEAGSIELVARKDLVVGRPASGFDVCAEYAKAKASGRIDLPEIEDEIDLDAARDLLKAVPSPSSAAINWYGGKSSPDLSEARLQAARSYPVLAGVIADSPGLAMAVDRREPLQQAIIERIGLSKAGLKRLGKLSDSFASSSLFDSALDVHGEDALGVNRQRRFAVSGMVSVESALRHLASLPPDRVPDTNAAWLKFHDVLVGCAIPVSNAFDLEPAEILAASKGNWERYHAALAKAADFSPETFDRRAMALATIDALEAMEDFSRMVLLPAMLAKLARAGRGLPEVSADLMRRSLLAAGRLFIGKSTNIAGELFETARRYAGRIPALMEAEGREREKSAAPVKTGFERYGAEGFPLLADDFHSSNGLVVRPLRNFTELRQESKRLSHCVGNLYLSRARQAQCHIFSIQSLNGMTSHSTIELSPLVSGRRRLKIVQHRGRRNSEPPAKCKEAAAEWLRDIRGGKLELNIDEVLRWSEHIKGEIAAMAAGNTDRMSWKGALGVDAENLELMQRLWIEWKPILGGPVGKTGDPEELLSHPSVEGLYRSLSSPGQMA